MEKVVLITGASSGIGHATAKLMAEKGFKVYAGARRLEKMKDLKDLGAVSVKMDVTKEEDNKRVVDKIIKEEGRIDVLINNAGFGLYGPVEDISIEDAKYQFEVNIFGLAHLTQLVIPHMRKQKSGRIISTSSMGGKIYTPLGAWYHATKHALEGWSDCLRLELKPFNIKVVLIEPGGVKTEFGDVMSKRFEKYYDKSAYKDQMDPYIKMMKDSNFFERATEPVVLANEFLKAATDRNPKRRYVKGMMAKPALFVRKWFGDGVYEWMISKAFR